MSDNQSDNAPEWGRVLHAAARRSATPVPDPRDARIAELERDQQEQSLRYVSLWGELQTLVEERDALRSDFAALQHALVGNTGASAILTAERLRSELAEARRDAARYRHLRDVAWHSGSLIFYAERYGPEDWDAHIDAALKGEA